MIATSKELTRSAPWLRPKFRVSSLRMHQMVVCFADDVLDHGQFSLSKFGAPSEPLVDLVDLRQFRRAECSEWFEGWFNAAFGVFARSDLKGEYDQLSQSQVCYCIRLETDDQPDLAPIQTTWAMARWLVDTGATFVLDLPALRYRTGDAVNAMVRDELRIQDHVGITCETDATKGSRGHLMHTRGMAKFARPDLVTWDEPAREPEIVAQLNTFARALAEGASPEDLTLRDGKRRIGLAPFTDTGLLEALGIEAAVQLRPTESN